VTGCGITCPVDLFADFSNDAVERVFRMPGRAARRRIPKGRASPAVVARPLVFLVVIAGGLGRVANQLPAGPYNEPLGRAPPRAKGLQHVLSDAGVTKSDEERCIVGADIRLTA
jgi:hypothetical protein